MQKDPKIEIDIVVTGAGHGESAARHRRHHRDPRRSLVALSTHGGIPLRRAVPAGTPFSAVMRFTSLT